MNDTSGTPMPSPPDIDYYYTLRQMMEAQVQPPHPSVMPNKKLSNGAGETKPGAVSHAQPIDTKPIR